VLVGKEVLVGRRYYLLAGVVEQGPTVWVSMQLGSRDDNVISSEAFVHCGPVGIHGPCCIIYQ